MLPPDSALPEVALAVTWLGLTAYVLFGGADFGGGFWDLLAGGSRRGARQRDLVEHSIGPVWEANHVWLIFVIVMLWTAFPSVFAAASSTLYIPLTLAALGIIVRGSAFVFRKVSDELGQRRAFGAAFAFSSVVTPFFLGACAGAVASERVPPGIAQGDPLTAWVNPTSLTSGLLAVGVGAYLAAVYLTRDAQRAGAPDLAEAFRRRALLAGIVIGGLSITALAVIRADAPELFTGLTSQPALSIVTVSIVAGATSLVLLWRRAFLAVRITASLAVAALIGGWGAARFPELLPGVTVDDAAATDSVLAATLIALGVGALLLVPSLIWLYRLSQRFDPHDHQPGR